MSFSKVAGAFAALTLSLGAASAAQADVYNLNLSQAQSGLPAPYGQVEVTQNGANQLKFVVTLFDGLKFVDTGAHHTFAFSLDNVTNVVVNAPTGFNTGGGPAGVGNIPNSPYGGFDFWLGCNTGLANQACGNGGNSPYVGPLTFTVNGSNLTLANLGVGSEGIRFAADTWAPGGATGTIAGGTPVPGV